MSVQTIKRMEGSVGAVRGNAASVFAVQGALEAAGIEFTNGDAPGVRLRPSKNG